MKAILKLVPFYDFQRPIEGQMVVFVRGSHKEVIQITKIKTGDKVDYKYWLGWDGASVEWTNDISELEQIACCYTPFPFREVKQLYLQQDEEQWRDALNKIDQYVEIEIVTPIQAREPGTPIYQEASISK